MAGSKTRLSHWCMIRDSPKLRDLVKFKMDQKGMNLGELANATDIKSSRISKYLNNYRPNVTQVQLLTILKVLGIELTLDIKIIE